MIADQDESKSVATRDYPRPRVPVLPPLSGASLLGARRAGLPAVTDLGDGVGFASGAAAIAMALRAAGIGPGHQVLVPAYHCPSMIEPVRAVGAEPVLYRVTPRLEVDMQNLAARCGVNARAVLITHYFGFPQDGPALRAFCDQRQLTLIEDCAHAWFGRFAARPPGGYGDYAVASVRKFFPAADGGLLLSARRLLPPAAARRGAGTAEIKAGIDVLEEAFGYGRLGALYFVLGPLLALKSALWRAVKAWRRRRAPPESTAAVDATAAFDYILPEAVDAPMTAVSRGLMHATAVGRSVSRRRRNYQRLARALANVPGASALHSELPPTVMPYMFALLIDRPDRVFTPLKRMGVPIWRWDALADTGCPVADRYGQSLFQLPCHQELRDRELDWMIKSLRNVLERASAAGAHAEIGAGAERELDHDLVHPSR